MDNVLNIEKCKICEGLVRIEKNNHGLRKVCTCCGYYYSKEKGEDETEYLNPCGAYKLVTIGGITKAGTLGENLTKEEVLKMFNFSDISRLDMNKTYINYKDIDTNEFKVIFGNGKPESYEDFINTIKK